MSTSVFRGDYLSQVLLVSPCTTATARPMPLESLQHPLSVYQDLLEVNV